MVKAFDMAGLTEEQEALFDQLTPLQKRVCTEVLSGVHKSNRQSYYAAGGKAKTDEAADAAVSQILSNPKVSMFVDSVRKDQVNAAIMTREEALERLSKIARATIHDICTFRTVELDGSDGEPVFNTVWEMKESKDIDPVIAASIKSVTFTKNGPKIEMYDSTGSIKILSDLQGWNAPKKTELTGKDGSPMQVQAEVSAPEVAEALTGLLEKL